MSERNPDSGQRDPRVTSLATWGSGQWEVHIVDYNQTGQLEAFLAEEWEPFAVFEADYIGPRVALRRRPGYGDHRARG